MHCQCGHGFEEHNLFGWCSRCSCVRAMSPLGVLTSLLLIVVYVIVVLATVAGVLPEMSYPPGP